MRYVRLNKISDFLLDSRKEQKEFGVKRRDAVQVFHNSPSEN
jgi:hypothetical protein